MSVVHPSSSRRLRILLAVSLATVFVSGCSATSDPDRRFFENIKTSKLDRTTTGSVPESRVRKQEATESTIGLELRPDAAKATRDLGIEPSALSGVRIRPQSAACRYLRKSADSEALIVGSPTASASSDDDGSGSVSIGMNLLDFRKAELIRASGDAKCRLHEANKKIEATLGLGVEATRLANAWAKQDHIRRNLGSLNRIGAEVQSLVNQGAITVQDANLVNQRISELKADMQRFKAEADRRKDLPSLDISEIRNRHGALVQATNDLQNIEREIRTNDALEVSVSTGYRFNERFDSDLQRRESEGAFARVTLGVKLGAISPTRKRLEQEAAGAKLDALFAENTGTIWKSGFSKRATEQMINNLEQSAQTLQIAEAHAADIVRKLDSAERPEVVRARLLAKVERIRVGSNLAAVRASIRQLKANNRKIGALSE